MSTLIVDECGTVRFKSNRIVCELVTTAGEGGYLTLNDIAAQVASGAYTLDEWQELYQLMGYSVDGYLEVFGIVRLKGDLQ